jgi:peptide deformylase
MLELVTHPNDILDKCLPDFDFNDLIVDPALLEAEMIELMIRENGRGISANQVGIEARVFVIAPSSTEGHHIPFALFNPTIVAISEDMESDYEGCLSFPNLFFKVNRPKSVVAEYFDKHNNKCIIELTGIDARCFLHELDHLNGICFIDRVSKLKLDLAIKKQRKRNGRTK